MIRVAIILKETNSQLVTSVAGRMSHMLNRGILCLPPHQFYLDYITVYERQPYATWSGVLFLLRSLIH